MNRPNPILVIKRPGLALLQALGLLCVAWAAGCSEDAGLIVHLRVDPALGSEAALAQHLVRIELLLDAPGGFLGLEDQSALAGLTRSDVDGDGQDELLLGLDHDSSSRLPRIRIDPGQNLESKIGIRVRGLDEDGTVAAFGGITPRFLFAAGRLTEIQVPFNPNRSHRPARIIALAPQDVPESHVLGATAFYSSRQLELQSLNAGLRVTLKLASSGDSLPIAGRIEGPHACPRGLQMYTFVPEQCQLVKTGGASIQLAWDEQVVDMEGNPLTDNNGHVGVTHQIDFPDLWAFGNCTTESRCRWSLYAFAPDRLCDLTSEMVVPFPCSISPRGCMHMTDPFYLVNDATEPQCRTWSGDLAWANGACVIEEPWHCSMNVHCEGIGTGKCDSDDLCVADACLADCPQDDLACLPGTGCLPLIGSCAQDCSIHGGCPRFDQTCDETQGGSWICE